MNVAVNPVVASTSGPAARTDRESLIAAMASLVFAGVTLKIVLDFSYLTLMRDLFDASTARTVDTGRLLASYVLVGVGALGIGCDVAWRPGPGNIATLLYFGFVLVPMLSLFGFGSPYADAGFVTAAVAAVLLVVAWRLLLPDLCLRAPGRYARGLLAGVFGLMTVYVYGGLFVTGGLERLNFDLALVYDVREELELAPFPLANYVVPWQAYVLNMGVLAVLAHGRRWAGVGLVLALQVVLFGMTNHKSFLFAPVLVLGLLLFARTPLRLAWTIVAGGAVVILLAVGLYLVTDQIMIPSIFVRRLFFVPAELHLWYHDFFSEAGNPFVMLSNSIFRALGEFPYAEPVPQVIGWAYTGSPVGANAGWLADAYAQFGYAGMVAFGAVLALVLRTLDGIAARLPSGLAYGLVAVPSMALVNSGLLTVLLTHGLGVALLFAWGIGRPAEAGT